MTLQPRLLLGSIALAVLTACTGTSETQEPEASGAVVPVTIGLTYVPDVQFEQRIVVRRGREREAAAPAVLEQEVDVLAGEEGQLLAGR